jgi:hypothetical protein
MLLVLAAPRQRDRAAAAMEGLGAPLVSWPPPQPQLGGQSPQPRAPQLRMVVLQSVMQSLRILIGYIQVVVQLGPALHVELPYSFVHALKPLRVLAADLSALRPQCLLCLTAYEQWVVYVLAFPAGVAVLVLGLYWKDLQTDRTSAWETMKERAYFVLFLVPAPPNDSLGQ